MGNQSQMDHGFNGYSQEWNHQGYNQGAHGNFQQEPKTFVPQQIYQERPYFSSICQEDETIAMLKKVLERQNEGHMANMAELDAMNSKVDVTFGELYAKFEQLNSYVEDYESKTPKSQSSQEASSQANQDQRDATTQMLQEILEGQKKCAIEIASRHEEVQRKFEDLNDKIHGAFEELDAKIEKLNDRVNTLDKKIACSSNDFCGAIFPNMKNGIEDEASKKEKVMIEEIGKKANGKRNSQEDLALGKNGENKKEEKDETSLYTPKLPFPGRFPTKAKKKEYKQFRDALATLDITLPKLDAITEVPSIRKFVKGVIDNKVQVEEILAIHTFGETPKPSPIKLENEENKGFKEDDLDKKKSLKTCMVCESKTNDVVKSMKKVIASPPRACMKKNQEEENVLGYGNEEALALDGVCLESLFSTTIENESDKSIGEPFKVKKGKSKKKKKKKSKKKQATLPPTQVETILQLALLAIGQQKLQEFLTKSLPLNLYATHASPYSPTQWSPLIPPSPNLPKDQG
ncbi:hypothetical protein ISN44_As13g008530 [Arabidopsis suecica]|uniref:Uncharacterized protein n=1 Tax=Arabidopsis suecica TaxID=45249 RepID=A0A8T1XS52_ARASU|nr:hypothetical protein ISN44_As13g008530 [Arabidopsis suecica]